jgi:hypothetical protein
MLMFLKYTLFITALVALSQSPSALASNPDMKIRMLSPSGEDLSNPGLGDERIVAVLVYERTETTQLCGGPKSASPVSMKLTVHADGNYTGIATTSRLDCSSKRRGVVRKAAVSRHGGKLSIPDLASFWGRLSEMTQAARELAATDSAEGSTRIQKAKDLRGVLSERELEESIQTGAAAEMSARFMQSFIFEGKIN